MVIRTHYDLGQIVNVKRVAGQKKKDGKWILNHEWRPGKIYEIIVKITKFNPLSYITYVIYDLENQKDTIRIGQNEMHKIKPYFKMEIKDELSTHLGA